jgi:hypothetical protein
VQAVRGRAMAEFQIIASEREDLRTHVEHCAG